MNFSVEAHQIITMRSTFFSSRKRWMSSRIAFSIARLLMVPMVLSALMFFTYSRSNAAFIGRIARNVSEIASMWRGPSSTPARWAAT